MSWSVEKMLELGHRHAQLEAERRLEPLMETLVENPAYEFHPVGLGMSGGDRVRRYYAQFFEYFMESIHGYRLLDEWANENAVVQEYEITTEADGLRETHRVIGILFAAETVAAGGGRRLLGGERVYASERCVRLMVGDLYPELASLERAGADD